jgi:hypothetical protein
MMNTGPDKEARIAAPHACTLESCALEFDAEDIERNFRTRDVPVSHEPSLDAESQIQRPRKNCRFYFNDDEGRAKKI